MKKWRLFPILVKEEILKNMDLSNKLSFSKCSKKCQNLLRRIPNHLGTFKATHDFQLSVDDFLMLFTSRISTLQELEVIIKTPKERDQVNQFLLKLGKIRNSIKVKELFMSISPGYSEMYKEVIGFCDPLTIEFITIRGLHSQEIYEYILKTPQWKNSQKITLNVNFERSLKVNIDDFVHFKTIKLGVEELSIKDAWKLVQILLSNGSKGDYIDIRCQKHVQGDSIRQKIESEMVGDWKNGGYIGGRYLVHPKNPHLVLEYNWIRSEFYVTLITLKDFEKILASRT